MAIKQPFPWFGGKSMIAEQVWQIFGDGIRNYIEPFFGGGAVLLNRPSPQGTETINDKDGCVANFWRASIRHPDEVADAACWPVNEADCHAREIWLLERKAAMLPMLEGSWDWCDPEIAGIWLHGVCAKVGGGIASGNGSWVRGEDGRIAKGDDGIRRQRPHLGNAGMGINRKTSKSRLDYIKGMMRQIRDRMQDVRVCCGDWSRVMGPSVFEKRSPPYAIFLDPPYFSEDRSAVYAEDASGMADPMRLAIVEACLRYGEKGKVILCGYEGEYPELDGWRKIAWKAQGGMSNQNREGNENKGRERMWISPSCGGGRTLFG
jgi:DNA adenine methylase